MRVRSGTKLNDRRGAVMVFMVAGIVMLLAMVMMSVDVATMQLTRTELRAATDSAAKAGTEALLRTQNKDEAVKAAVAFAQLNSVGGKTFKINSADVVVGTSTVQSDGSWDFAAGGTRPNSVRVNSSMASGSASGPVTLAFSKFFNAGSFTPTKSSTASAMQQEICLAIDRSSSMSFDLSGTDWNYPNGGSMDKRPKKSSRWDSLLSAVGIYLDAVGDSAIKPRVALVTWGSDMQNLVPTNLVKAPADANDIVYSTKELFSTILKGFKGNGWAFGQILPSVTASLDTSLTYDYTQIGQKLVQRTDYPIIGATNMAAGIDKGVETLTSSSVLPYAQKVMILMTDGQWNEGRDPLQAAADARDKGVMIHVVTFLPEAKAADAQSVATITGGLYFHANNQTELEAAFEKIARTLPVVLTD
jgi:Flp pilus assembly protein TadG